jgi:4a-hydroxytetrahydrobiopterin dehydratase
MDMLTGESIAAADLTDWRKLAQGLHARFSVPDLAAGTRFLSALAESDPRVGEHLTASLGATYVDLALVSPDAVYRSASGTEYIVQWVTQDDLDLARRISTTAAHHGLASVPGAVTQIELGIDTNRAAAIAPVWAALLTGDAASQGRGSPSDEVRDATERVPHVWFGEPDGDDDATRRFHVEIYVAPEEFEARRDAALAAGGVVVDDSEAGMSVIADPDGNRIALCADITAVAAG